jgi:DNA-binding NtrC family response regulator
MAIKILVVDDDSSLVLIMSDMLSKWGYEIQCASSAAACRDAATSQKPDIIFLDVNLPDQCGLELIPVLQQEQPQAAIIMMTAGPALEAAVTAIKKGAEDYLAKPFEWEELEIRVRRVAEKQALKREVESLARSQREAYIRSILFLSSPAMRRLYDHTEKAAHQDDAAVLVCGETGSGKEHIARLLHALSQRASRPFTQLHGSVVPQDLIDPKQGSATATLLERAQGGTLFLDEVEAVPVACQPLLLAFLEKKSCCRDGKDWPVDLRVVASTSAALEKETSAGRFLPGLLYRLNVLPLEVPSLRSRPGDVKELARFFLNEGCRLFDRDLAPFTEEQLALLASCQWRGNVRELRNTIHRLVILAAGRAIRVGDLPASFWEAQQAKDKVGQPTVSLDDAQRVAIQRALEQHEGNQKAASRTLGVARQTLINKMKKYGLCLPKNRSAGVEQN